MGYDEVTIGAATLKFENDPDPELADLRREFNEASRMDLVAQAAQNVGGGGHSHPH